MAQPGEELYCLPACLVYCLYTCTACVASVLPACLPRCTAWRAAFLRCQPLTACCILPPLLQTRVAKLPKSVLKARAHKSTSDIPLDLLLTGGWVWLSVLTGAGGAAARTKVPFGVGVSLCLLLPTHPPTLKGLLTPPVPLPCPALPFLPAVKDLMDMGRE